MASQDRAQDLKDLIAQRRRALYGKSPPPHGSGWWGLALSGGGIRSATFCWGLVQALARQGELLRFDLISTVSGGGYLGAALGRLFDRAESPQQVRDIETQLGAHDERWFGHWLRDGARFLQRGGKLELAELIGTFLRNLMAIHLEIAQLAIALGLMLMSGNLLLWWAWPGSPLSVAWLLAALPALLALWLAIAYWNSLPPASPEEQRSHWRWGLLGLLVLIAMASHQRWMGDTGLAAEGAALRGHAATVLLAMALAVGSARLGIRLRLRRQAARLARQGGGALSAQGLRRQLRGDIGTLMARTIELTAALLLLGLLDWLAWQLAFGAPVGLGWLGGVAALLGVSRALWPRLVALLPGVPKLLRGATLQLVNALGLLLLGLLVALWMALAYRLAIGLTPDGTQIATVPSLWFAALGLLMLAALQGLSQGRLQMLNHSSLHAFYRSRLTRSFLGAANPARFAQAGDDGPLAMLAPVRSRGSATRFIEADARDDVGLVDYAPQRHGGPVHLINVCVNETQNLRGGISNVDRRGQLLTLAPLGLARMGLAGWRPLPRGHDHSLGTWMAVSGAALAPGLGSLTQPGIAALLTLMGARLGLWWQGAANWGSGLARRLTRRELLLRELLGLFDRRQPAWFLSDGGHFENTGAYALLAQEAALIVVADCGADPAYQFNDLENLVRLARIDLQAEIQFLKPRPGARPPLHVGALDDLAGNESEACIAVAQVRYLRSGREGLLILVKPNLFQGLPIDLVNFRRKNEEFPQQASTDQSFSEAQWESYHKLGEIFGAMLLQTGLLDPARPWAPVMVPDDGRHVHDGVEDPAKLGTPRPRLGPALAKPAVAAGVGAGALLTAGVSLWTVLELLQPPPPSEKPAPLLNALAPAYGRVASGNERSEARAGELASALLLQADLHCRPKPDAAAQQFQRSVIGQCLLRDTLDSCALVESKVPVCRALLRQQAQLRACLTEPGQPPRRPIWGNARWIHEPLRCPS